MINAHLGLSYMCNMNCNHCYVKQMEKEFPRQAHGLDLLDKLEELGIFYLTYTLAETLLYDPFWRFAEEAGRRGFYQILLSNGTTLQDTSILQRLDSVNIRRIGISIDHSDSDIHDANRNYAGAHRLAVHALEIIAQSKVPILPQITMTIHSGNLMDISNVLALGKRIGVSSFSFLWLREHGKIAPIQEVNLYARVMRQVIQARQNEGLDINVHDYRLEGLLDAMLKAGDITTQTREEFHWMNDCHAYKDLILINPAGDVYACNFSPSPFANICASDWKERLKREPTFSPLCEVKTDDIQ